MQFRPVKEQLDILLRGVAEIIPADELEQKLQKSYDTGIPLRVKLGVDPTAPDVHLGHTVVMRKLRQFQDLGHTVVLIVGDYTAQIGDPSGRNKARPRLSHEQVLENAKEYQQQFFRVVREDRVEIRYNGEWFSKLPFSKVTELMGQFTVAQMLEREDFHNRYVSNSPISLHEFMYPMMQGYDAAVLEVDERSSPRIYPYVQPDVLVVTNLYRDSIKRNGHSEFIFGKIAQALPAGTRLLLNGDDMISGLLGEGSNERVFFRVARTSRSTDTCVNTACDRSACPRCGHLLAFDYFHYHHIGRSHCPKCGFALPEATYEAVDTDFETGNFVLREPGQEDLHLSCKQGTLFSVYNITAAVGCCRMLNILRTVANCGELS